MITPDENYEQEKIKGHEKQVVILDEAETGETDQLDPNFYDDDESKAAPDPEPIPGAGLDGEGIDERLAGLSSNLEDEKEQAPEAGEAGLNRSADDDLSLNGSKDDLF